MTIEGVTREKCVGPNDQNNGNYISRTLAEIDHFYIHFICITRRRAPSYRTIKKWEHFFFILLACISDLLTLQRAVSRNSSTFKQ